MGATAPPAPAGRRSAGASWRPSRMLKHPASFFPHLLGKVGHGRHDMIKRARRGGRPRTHFSMIRNFHLADLFTIANGFCGVAALFWAMKFLATGVRTHLYSAALFVPLALIF